MPSWQQLLQSLQQIVKAFIRFVKARRREEVPIALAALLLVNNPEPLAKLTNLIHLTLDLSDSSQVNNLGLLLKLSPQTLELTLTTEQRLSLKAIPKSVTSLEF
jgi:hypothetical protein